MRYVSAQSISSFQRWNLLPKTGRHSTMVPRRQSCPGHTKGTGSWHMGQECNHLLLQDLPSPGPGLFSQKPSEQPNYPLSPSGPGARLWELSVVLRSREVECVCLHSLKDMGARSERLQNLLALSLSSDTENSPDSESSREGT